MATMPLDLTGSLVSNKVTGEVRSITRDIDRYFVPVNGAIYDNNGSFKIYNAVSGARLQPNTQYRLLHLVDEAVKISNKNVYAVIYIVDKTLTSVRIDYQAVGGVYQNIASTINDKLSEYLLGTTGSNTIGNVVGVPVQVPPEQHLQNLNDFQGAGALLAVLESIRKAVLLGNGAAFAACYEYIDLRFQQSVQAIISAFNAAEIKRAILEEKTQIKDGDYIITTNPANPSSYLGYGNWVLDTNVLLYGAQSDADVGNFIDVGIGSGLVGVKRFFWRRDDSTAGATYSLSTNATAINEGQTVTITLTTNGLTTGTKIAYTITGVSENDMVGTKLNGNFIINDSGVATLPIEIRQDMETEGVEVLRLSLTAMPSIAIDVSINDTSIAATYGLRFSGSANGAGDISSVNEGSSAYLAITTSGVAPNTRLYLLYNDSTVSLSDSTTNAWPTTVDVAANGSNILEYAFKADQLTEGTETIVVNVCTTNNINSRVARTVLTVNDSSRSPSGTIKFSSNSAGTAEISQTNEGTTAYLFINTTNINNGEFVDLAYAGTVTAEDFSNALPTRVTINNNQAIVTLNVLNDVKTEGDETFVVRALYNGTQITEKTLIIKDTSVNPSYNLKFSTNSSGTDTITRANEGASVYLYIETSNVADGTVLNITYTGTVNPADDFVNYPRSLTVIGNRASGVIIIKADQLSEGEENVIAEVKNGTDTIGTAMLYINDTSASPSAAIRFSTVSSGSNTVTQTNEGTTVYAIIETTNINNGTVINLTHSGSSTADDFVNTRASSVTINNNVGYIELQVKNDLLTEGEETYRLSAILPNGETVTSGELRIIDTSLPSLNVYFSAASNGSGQVTTFDEGSTAYLVIETTGIATGTTGVNITYTGTTVESDISNGNYGLTNVTITGSRTIISYPIENDSREDGTKTMTVHVTVPGISTTKQATITINDTSKYSRLTASGNIVVPAGKVARIILMAGNGIAKYNNAGGASYVESTMNVDGYTLHLAAGSHGSPVTVMRDSGAIYAVIDGVNAASTFNLRGANEPTALLNINENMEVPPDVDGIAQLITVVGKPGADPGLIKTFNMTNITPAIETIIEKIGNPVEAPQESYAAESGDPNDVATPGFGAGSNAIVMIYNNKGSTARTISVGLANAATPSISGIRGENSTCIYELFDTREQAKLGYKPAIIADNISTVEKTFNWPNLIAPGEAYLVTIVGGGGASKSAFNSPTGARSYGQTVKLFFNATADSGNTIEARGADAAGAATGNVGAGGRITTTGVMPSYITVVGMGGNTVNNFSVGTGDDRKDTDSPIYGMASGFTIIPNPRHFVTLPWRGAKIAYGAPGFNLDNSVGVGGSGRAYTILINNTTALNISLSAKFDPYGYSAIDPIHGKPAAIIMNRVLLTGKSSAVIKTDTVVSVKGSVISDAGYEVYRGVNLADEFLKSVGRLPTANDNITFIVESNQALIGNDASKPGLTIDTRCNNVSSITINNAGYIAGLGGNGAGGDVGGKRGLVPTEGNTGIKNTSNVIAIVYNTGLIGGGGGGMGCFGISNQADTAHGGTGGVPYGYSNRSGAIGTVPLTDAAAGSWAYKPTLLGVKGLNGNMGSVSAAAREGKVAGLIKEGLVTINNIGSGITKGR